MNHDVKEILKLGKAGIIQLAIKFIGVDINLENFAKISVMANNREVFVSFLSPIKYLPIGASFACDIEVQLIEKSSSWSDLYNPINDDDDSDQLMDLPFYQETEEAKKNIQFVIEAIQKTGSFDATIFDDSMIIRNKKDHYNISLDSEHQHSWYKIAKESGEIYDAGHMHMEPQPFLEDDGGPLVEITN